MSIPINSIQIPIRFIELCEGWHCGLSCKLYAVHSAGGLYTGNIKPLGCNTPKEWYLYLWRDLACDISRALRVALKSKHPDAAALAQFERFADETVTRLSESYGLTEWEPVA